MQTWVTEILNSSEFSLMVLPASFVLGLLAVTTSCCTPALLAVLAGYSGASSKRNKRDLLFAGGFFIVGTVLALAIVGAAISFVGQVAGSSFGTFLKILAGVLAILFGMSVLNLLPFKIPAMTTMNRKYPEGIAGAAVFGFAVGGGSIVCGAGCNPLIIVPISFAFLQGKMLWGISILVLFALGYALPLAGMMVGLQAGFGKLENLSNHLSKIIKPVAGILLIAIGFYLLLTM